MIAIHFPQNMQKLSMEVHRFNSTVKILQPSFLDATLILSNRKKKKSIFPSEFKFIIAAWTLNLYTWTRHFACLFRRKQNCTFCTTRKLESELEIIHSFRNWEHEDIFGSRLMCSREMRNFNNKIYWNRFVFIEWLR